jgi:hypothetical protein
LSKRRLWNLEFHGIDLADAEEDGIPGELVRHQPDLKKTLAEKREVLHRILRDMADRFDFVTCEGAAEKIRASPSEQKFFRRTFVGTQSSKWGGLPSLASRTKGAKCTYISDNEGACRLA